MTPSPEVVAKRTPVVKVLTIGSDGATRATSNATEREDVLAASFQRAEALSPPYNPTALVNIFEASSALRPNVDAYATNIDGHGWHLEPTIRIDGDDVEELVRGAMHVDRLVSRQNGKKIDSVNPTDQEVEERISQINDDMLIQKYRVERFLNGCVFGESFVSLRKKIRQDLEVTGNAYWEVLRDSKNRVVQFTYLPSPTMRLRKRDTKRVEVEIRVPVSPISTVTEKLRTRFRTYVQVIEGHVVFFKQFGDPRVMSAKTGKFFKSDLEMQQVEGKDAVIATEVMHFKVHSSTSAYGVPRWIGALLSVLGAHDAEEVNFAFFQNKSIPPLAVTVSGGRMTSETVDRIKTFIQSEVKGKDNFHSVLILEAEQSSDDIDGLASGRTKIDIKPLTAAIMSDATHQEYDKRCLDKVGFQFRNPRLLRGDSSDFNRATAMAALEMAEAQVYGPERTEFDHLMNTLVLSTMGAHYWRFVSNAPEIRDPKELAEICARLTATGVLVPADSREIVAEQVFRRELPTIDADWIWQPVTLTQVGVPFDAQRDNVIPAAPGAAGGQPAAGAAGQTRGAVTRSYGGKRPSDDQLAREARTLVRLANELARAEAEDARADHARAQAASQPTQKVIRMPRGQIREKFAIEDA